MDTPHDYRILLAEDALKRLENIVKYNRLGIPLNINRLLGYVYEMKTLLYRLKYMYLPYRDLARTSEAERIKELAGIVARELLNRELLQKFKPNRMAEAEARYALRVLYGLKYRIMLGDGNNPLYAVDIEGVEIVSVSRHPNSDRLYVTKAEGILPYVIVTNISNIKKGEIRAAVILPPVDLRGIISEAMYCSKPIPTEYKGKRVPEKLIYSDEVKAKIIGLLRSF